MAQEELPEEEASPDGLSLDLQSFTTEVAAVLSPAHAASEEALQHEAAKADALGAEALAAGQTAVEQAAQSAAEAERAPPSRPLAMGAATDLVKSASQTSLVGERAAQLEKAGGSGRLPPQNVTTLATGSYLQKASKHGTLSVHGGKAATFKWAIDTADVLMRQVRLDAGRPDDVTRMTLGELRAEKNLLKVTLRRFDQDFQAAHGGRSPTKMEKEPLRPLYQRYKAVRNLLANAEAGGMGGAGSRYTVLLKAAPKRPFLVNHFISTCCY